MVAQTHLPKQALQSNLAPFSSPEAERVSCQGNFRSFFLPLCALPAPPSLSNAYRVQRKTSPQGRKGVSSSEWKKGTEETVVDALSRENWTEGQMQKISQRNAGPSITTESTASLQGRQTWSRSGDGRRNTFLRTSLGEVEVAGVLTLLPRKGFFKEKQCQVGCFPSRFHVILFMWKINTILLCP